MSLIAVESGLSTAPITAPGLAGVNSVGDLFTVITNVIIMVGLGLVLVFLALGFIKFITSQGDKVATEQAQKWVTYAIIGGVGLFAVFAIKTLILNLMGVKDPLDDSGGGTPK
jgi:hypothetical protein